MRYNTQSASPAGRDAWHPINWLGANSFFMGDRKQAPSVPSQAAITRPNFSTNSDNVAGSLNTRGIRPSTKLRAPANSATPPAISANTTPQTGVLVTAALEQLVVCVEGCVGVGVGVGEHA